jgi:DnaJ like chaperone protein
MHLAERRVLEAIAADLGISAKDLASLDAMFRGPSTSSAYTILEVDPKASDDEVKKAYRRMAMKHHPDRVATSAMSSRKPLPRNSKTCSRPTSGSSGKEG